ncbi:flagellar filament capping protein FliD [Neobacillus citreus]|uniref:Flagellar hook-associated protein 2 n=1 Tax=Neobacillus citreus TaxID=2833578 RepID=A0A9J6MLJ5_9BACI|nr:flagellar filament capping protein FliD [Neobacillus citreus]MCH6263914.1 flagellar filament capping protein FliD [Neobacillus citreus]
MINNHNTLRVTGLASGMNTDEIVANLVKVQSSRLNKMQQAKTWTTWKTDAYRDINKKVDEFRKAMEGLRLQSTFNKQVTTSSNDSVVSAAVTGIPTQSSYQITNVQQAKDATTTSVKFFLTTGLDTTQTLGNVTPDADGKIRFTVNSSTIEFSPTDTISTVLNKITNDPSVSVSYSSTEKSLTFTNDTAGNLDLTIGGTPDLLAALNIQAGTTSTSLWGDGTSDTSITKGTDKQIAKMTINGLEYRSDTNKITYDGITFDIKSDFPAGNISINSSSDTDAVFNSIKTFVDKYNEIIDDLNGRLTEKRYRDYPPLLDEQKKDMKDSDIKLWEDKAKSGLLSGDSTIRNFLYEMRNSLSNIVENSSISTSFNSLKSIGIDFSTSYRDNGKLILNEEKLKGTLKSNLDDVKNLFTVKGTGTKNTVEDTAMHQTSGFGWRIYDRLKETISQLGTLAGSPNSVVDTKSYMAKQLKSLNENIDNEQNKVNAYEQRLWKQFTAMEKALSQLNSQSSWLSQQLGM